MLTIGAEEEFFVTNNEYAPARFNLKELSRDSRIDISQLSREMHDSVIETKTGIHSSILSASNELIFMRNQLATAFSKDSKKLLSCGTHPSADYRNVHYFHDHDYGRILDEYQVVAKESYVCGLHIHVGGIKQEHMAKAFNFLRRYIPLLIAVSANSFFVNKSLTGLSSNRTSIFSRFPRSGIPAEIASLDDYFNYIQWLISTGSIFKATSIWTDIRIHPTYKTIEVRSLDAQTNHHKCTGLIALVVAIIKKSITAYDTHSVEDRTIQENRWRAIRYGLHAEFIGFDNMTPITAISLLEMEIMSAVDFLTKEEVKSLYYLLKPNAHASSYQGEMKRVEINNG